MKTAVSKLFSMFGKVAITISQVLNIRQHSEASALVESLRFYGYKYQIDTSLSHSGLQYILHTECVGMRLEIPLGERSLENVIKYLKLQLRKQQEKENKQWEHQTM